MRKVENWNQVNDALREIWNTLDSFKTNNLDMRKRRAVNASPSIDKYDYVVRKELENLVSKGVIDDLSNLYTIVFSNPGTITAGVRASSPFIVQRPGIPILVAVSAVNPPDTDDAIFNVSYGDSTYILTSDIHLPAGATSQQVFTSSALINILFEYLGVLNLWVVSTGQVPAIKVSVEVFVKES